ncbi:MAG: sigma factor-like helix-turn-helix DNA-binding protein [Clostridia bacterium]|jgi:hypothetical protein|nr:sigma factor-like helix-turn-helix DNA-binding protein [Clostridia bacterium]
MNFKNMIKTIFSVYRFLDKIAYSIDKIVETRALNACYMYLDNTAFNDVVNVSNDIMELTQRKITLINLKVLATSMIKNLDKNYARLIIMKYIENKPYAEIGKLLNISERTVTRWHSNAVVSSYFYLENQGYTLIKLLEMLKKERWILQTFYSFSQNKENQDTENANMIKHACKEYKKVLCK